VCQDDEVQLTELLTDKHINYVANHGNDKNDFVRKIGNSQLSLINLNSHIFVGIYNDRVS
jgi:hypothetical protein